MSERVTVSVPLDDLKLMYLSMCDCSNRLGTGNMTIDHWINYLEETYQDVKAIREKIDGG